MSKKTSDLLLFNIDLIDELRSLIVQQDTVVQTTKKYQSMKVRMTFIWALWRLTQRIGQKRLIEANDMIWICGRTFGKQINLVLDGRG